MTDESTGGGTDGERRTSPRGRADAGDDGLVEREAPDPFRFDEDERDRSAGGTDRAARDPRIEVPGAHRDPRAPDVPAAPDAREPQVVRGPIDVVRRVNDVGGAWMATVLAGTVVLAFALVLLGGRDRPVEQVAVGERFPVFAAPLATRPRLEFDAVNLASANDQGDLGRIAACGIRDPAVVTSCALLRRGPVLLTIYAAGEDECARAGDVLEQVDVPGAVSRLLVAGLGEHDAVGRVVRQRRWTMPVVYDRDGALYRRLGAPGCATTFVVARDGRVRGRLEGAASRAAVERLVRAVAG